MNLNECNVVRYKKERQDEWKINESVWDWIVRKTDINPTKKGIEKLANELFIGEATLYRLKKSKQHSLNRESQRSLLSKHVIKAKGFDEQFKLGYYGYPPDSVYIDEPQVIQSQKDINNRITSDFLKIVELAGYKKNQICQFCDPVNYELMTDENATTKECTSIFLSTHRFKQYGAAAIRKGKGFELHISLCNKCLKKNDEIILIPVSSLIKKIINRFNLKQPQVAHELGVTQGVISRLLYDKAAFIDPELLTKIYGLYTIGPDSFYRHEHWKLLLLIADYCAEKLSEEEMLEKIVDECYLSAEYMPWYDDPSSFFWEYDIGNRPQTGNLVILGTSASEIYFDSNKISYTLEVDYMYESDSGYPHFENTSTAGGFTIEYILVDIKKRLHSEFMLKEEVLEVVNRVLDDDDDEAFMF
jgi:transcriptional regulator with XRE-family HTH domain